MATLGSGIGGIVWALTTNTPAQAPTQALGPPLTGFTGSVTFVAFSPDGHTLAASSNLETIIRLWNVTDPAHPTPLVQSIRLNDGTNSAAFAPDGHTLAAGRFDGTVWLWNVTDPAHPVSLGSPLNGFAHGVSSVAFSPDGHTLAAGGDDTVRLWAVR